MSDHLLYGLLTLSAALIAAAVTWYVFRGEKKGRALSDASKAWATAAGRIRSVGVLKHGSDVENGSDRYETQVSYAYDIAGQDYVGTRLDFLFKRQFLYESRAKARIAKYAIGDAVEIAYDPANPGNSVLDRSQKPPALSLRTVGLLGVTVVSAAFAIFMIASPETGTPEATQVVAAQSDRQVCREGADFDGRISACTRLIDAGSQTLGLRAEGFANRGLAYYTSSDYVHAIADLAEAVRLDPKDGASFGNRGNAYFGAGDFPKAIADYDAAIRLDPKDVAAYNNRGCAHVYAGSRVNAEADFKQARQLGRADPGTECQAALDEMRAKPKAR